MKNSIAFIFTLLLLTFNTLALEVELHSGDVSERTIWTKDKIHLITSDITVNTGIELTIEPGSVVKFYSGTRLRIYGALNAVGTAQEKIYFTSYRDDSVGGDTNGDDYSEGQAGDWVNIRFEDTVADSLTKLVFIEQRFAGDGEASIHFQGANVSVTDSVIRDSNNNGLYISDASPTLARNHIVRHKSSGIYIRSDSYPLIQGNVIEYAGEQGIYAYSGNSSPEIIGNRIANNKEWGIYFRAAVSNGQVIKNNEIINNQRPMMLPAGMMPNVSDGNTLVPNTYNAIWLRGQGVDRDLTLGQLTGGGESLNTYAITGSFGINSGSKLTIDPGVIMKFYPDAKLWISGELGSIGTAEKPIIYTSYTDDSVGGDTNGDGYGSSPARGEWIGISFNDSSPDNLSPMEHVAVRYAGKNNRGLSYEYSTQSLSDAEISYSGGAGLRVYRSTVSLNHVSVFANRQQGLYIDAYANVTATNSQIYGNGGHGIHAFSQGSITLNGGEIFANGGHGAYEDGSATVVADDIWWGAPDGPGGDGTGSGDEVNAGVTVSNSRTDGTEFSYFNAGGNTSTGTLSSFVALQGTDSTEWGTSASTRVLFDLEQVSLKATGLAIDQNFELFVTYLNKDNAASAGGNKLHLENGANHSIHDVLQISDNSDTYAYYLASDNLSNGELELHFKRDSGYRVAVSEVLLIEQQPSAVSQQSIVISSPLSNAVLSQGTINITGLASDSLRVDSQVELRIQLSGSANESDWRPATQWLESGQWRYQWQLPEDGEYQLSARVRHHNGQSIEVSTPIVVIVDQRPPEDVHVFFGTDVADDNGSSILLEWQSSVANDVASYRLERRGETGDFQFINDVNGTLSQYQDNTVSKDIAYTYRLTVIDHAANESVGVQSAAIVAKDNTGDTQAPEDISGLSVVIGDGEIDLTWQPSVDSSGDLIGYYLDISSDGGASWAEAVSLNRISQHYLVSGLTNGTTYRFRIRAFDGAGNVSVGILSEPVTPKLNAVTEVSGTLSQDTYWRTGVYYVSGNITVPVGNILTIAPGVVVKLGRGRSIRVNGQLDSQGTEQNPVYFTAYTDDSVGGDSNGDGNASTPVSAYWRSVWADNNAQLNLMHTKVRYGGSSQGDAIYGEWNAKVTLNHVESSHNGGNGVRVYFADLQVKDSHFHHNAASGIKANGSYVKDIEIRNTVSSHNEHHGFLTDGGAFKILLDGNTFKNNKKYGVYTALTQTFTHFKNNIIKDNTRAVLIPFSALPGVDDNNVIEGNQYQQIELLGNALARSVKTDKTLTYLVVSGSASVKAGSLLNIPAGSIWKFYSNTRLRIYGALNAVGTAQEKIYFTSYRDDSVGGDTNGDDYSEGQAGDWVNIRFEDTVADSLTKLVFIEQRFAGDGEASIHFQGANVSVTDSVIRDSNNNGLYISDASPTLARNHIVRHKSSGIYIRSDSYPLIQGNVIEYAGEQGIYAYSGNSSPEIIGNRIANNKEWGIYFRAAVSNGQVIKNNEIINNQRPMMLPAGMMPNVSDGNTLVPNTYNAIWLRGQGVDRDLTLGQLTGGGESLNTYAITGSFGINSGSKLTIDPGVIMKFYPDAKLWISGELGSIGTAEKPIIYTSYTDDSVGGDTNGDGYGSSPARGEWIGISFNDSSPDNLSPMEHVAVRYAGKNNRGLSYEYSTQSLSDAEISYSGGAGLRVYRSTVSLNHVSVFANRQQGLYIDAYANVTATNSQIYGNGGHGIHAFSQGSITLNGGEIFANGGHGAYEDGSATVVADDIWWGAPDGPGGDGTGSGDEVNAGVTVSNSRTDGTEFSYFNAGGNSSSSYGIVLANVSGTVSQKWGDDAASTVHYEQETQAVNVEYTGLDSNANYQLLATFYNQDEANVEQGVVDQNNNEILRSAAIPQSNIIVRSGAISASLIDDGFLKFDIIRNNGVRTHVSELLLIKNSNANNKTFAITLEQPTSGFNVGRSGTLISGTLSSEHTNEPVEIGIANAGSFVWQPVTNYGDGSWKYWWAPKTSASYQLKARLLKPQGQYLYSNVVNVQANLSAPAKPENLLASSSESTIRLGWNLSKQLVETLEEYQIFRKGNDQFQRIANVTASVNTYLDTEVELDKAYNYYIRLIDKAGNYSDSDVIGPISVLSETDITAPGNVTSLTAQYSLDDKAVVTALLNWNSPAEASADINEYRVYISINLGTNYDTDFTRIIANKTEHLITELSASNSYTFKVTTLDLAGNESDGVIATITPQIGQVKALSLSGTINHDMLINGGVWHLTGEVIVPEGIKLTINNGAILKFGSNVGLRIKGKLIAIGAEAAPIILTSLTDDIGGDTNGDLTTTTPIAGYWRGIYTDNDGQISLDQTRVSYAGSSNKSLYLSSGSSLIIKNSKIVNGKGDGVNTYYANVSIKDSLVEHHTDRGIYISRTATAELSNNIIRNNRQGIYSYFTHPSITGNTIVNNSSYGIYFYDTDAGSRLKNNTIINNGLPMMIPAVMFPDSSNVLFPNQTNRFHLRGGRLPGDTTFAAYHNQAGEQLAEYILHGGDLELNNNHRLTIQPGVAIKVAGDYQFNFGGMVIANGTSAEPIIFTSYLDDNVIADSNSNGSDNSPQRGDWGRVLFNGGPFNNLSQLSHIKIRFAGGRYGNALYLNGPTANIKLSDIEISNTEGDAVHIYNTSPEITSGLFWANSGRGIYITNSSAPKIGFTGVMLNDLGGIEVVHSASPVITNSRFFGNNQYAIKSSSSQTLDSEYNWWGDFDGTGPSHLGNNTGTGEQVIGNINYANYLLASEIDYLYVNFAENGVVHKGNVPQVVILQGTLDNNWDPVNKHPSKTALVDETLVHVKLTGLDPAKKYRLGLTYFNGDPSNNTFHLTDGMDNPIHPLINGPKHLPTLYDFVLPSTYYASGEMEIKLHHDSAATAFRVGLAELYLFEDIDDFSPPRFDSIEFNDLDGSENLSVGDELHFLFSEELMLSVDQSLVADLLFNTETDKTFGTENKIRWADDKKSIIVTFTPDFSYVGGETITVNGLIDLAGNPVIGNQSIILNDQIAPSIISVEWLDLDNSSQLTLGDQYRFNFSEVMNDSHLVDGTTDANANLRPHGGNRYGNVNTISWSEDRLSVIVTVTDGYSIQGDELVFPNSFITDKAGNSVVGQVQLQGRDVTPPRINQIQLDDRDGNGVVSIGDVYVFDFSESIAASGLSDGTNEANHNLSPAGKTYGEINSISCNEVYSRCEVSITEGFTVTGLELVTPSPLLTDKSGNTFENTASLTLVDTIAPQLNSVSGSQNNPVDVANSYQISLNFNSVMDQNLLPLLTFSSDGQAPQPLQSGNWQSNNTFVSSAIVLNTSMIAPIKVSVSSAKDAAGNMLLAQVDTFTILIKPEQPVIDYYLAAPQINFVTIPLVEITGTRPDNTAIYLNDQLVVAAGIGPWEHTVNLSEGTTSQRFVTVNENGTQSNAVTLNFMLDSTAPAVTKVTPANGTYFTIAPTDITILFSEIGSGLDLNATDVSLTKQGIAISGQLTQQFNELKFKPLVELNDGHYQVAIELTDNAGLVSSVTQTAFTIDNVAPKTPVLDPVDNISNMMVIQISGTKEIGTGIRVNGNNLVAANDAQIWQAEVTLVGGNNTLLITAFDYANNESPATSTIVFFDNTPPGLVLLELLGEPSGTELNVDWQAYDEQENGADISKYQLYLANQPFTNVNNANLIAELNDGQKQYTLPGLIRGNTYHLVVLAIDLANNALVMVNSQAITMADSEAPDNVTGLTADIGFEQIKVTWLAPPNAPDLGGYKLYINAQAPITLASNVTSYDIIGLTKATSYLVKVTTIDVSDNESEGISTTFVTLLDSPIGLVTTPLNNKANVSWASAQPQALVSAYRLYVDTQHFTNVSGKQPRAIVSAGQLQGQVNGLINGETYFVGVSVVNQSGAETQIVSSVEVVPETDDQGPEIQSVNWNNVALNSSDNSIMADGNLSVIASDESGVAAVDYLIDGTLLGRSSNGTTQFKIPLAIDNITDGLHTLTVKLWDTLDNEVTAQYSISVAIAVPVAPTITEPASNITTNLVQFLVEVAASVDQTVQLNVNGVATEWGEVDLTGKRQQYITLTEGLNKISATAKNRGGISPVSAEIKVTLDSSLPIAPANFYAKSKEAGVINLSWSSVTSDTPLTYNLYRSEQPFADETAGTKINSQPLTAIDYTDMPDQNGKYYYRVLAVNNLGTLGSISHQVSATADSELPHATSIIYEPLGQYDAANKVFGVGKVNIRVVVNEPLLTRPFLSLNPEGVAPLNVDLYKVTDVEYQGEITIPENYVSATAYALFSARDKLGNRGTSVLIGEKIQIDTVGPRVTSLVISPESPVKNDAALPVTLSFTAQFAEEVDPTTMTVTYDIDAGEPITVDNLTQVSATSWQGEIVLSAETGLQNVAYLRLNYQAKDMLSNQIISQLQTKAIQVYQGDLPPLGVPIGLQASAYPQGGVKLQWYKIVDAVGYAIYRRAKEADGAPVTEMTLLTEVIDVLSFVDTPPTDSQYIYAIASIRGHEGQTAYSALSDEVVITTDSIAPQAPLDMTAELLPEGVGVRWTVAETDSTMYFRLYRANNTEITSVAGLIPVLDKIYSLAALDTVPDPQLAGYVVTALDKAGNESGPSNTIYLNISLLPVNQLMLTQRDQESPVIKWQHSGDNIAGYDIFLEQGEISLKMTPQILTTKEFVDSGFNVDSRQYRIQAVDNNGVPSLSRNIKLPLAKIEPATEAQLKRGIINKLLFNVTNLDNVVFNNAQLEVTIKGRVHSSESFNLSPAEHKQIAVVVGGYKELAAIEDVIATLVIKPTVTDKIEIIRTSQMTVAQSSYVLRVETDGFVRGTAGKVRFILENPTALDIEIETAHNNGNSDSADIQIKLLDLDGNTITVAGFRQSSGEQVIATKSGSVIARIAAGQQFISDWSEVLLPATTPETVVLEFTASRLSYHKGRADQVVISGLSNSVQLNTQDTPYLAEITEITPAISYGEQPVLITGSVKDRETQTTLANAQLKLIIDVNGFERVIELVSNSEGLFSYQYQPQANENGLYRVSALHPDMTDRPEHGQFTIGNLSANYSSYNLTVPKLFEHQLPLTVTSGKGVGYQGIHWEVETTLPTGIQLTMPEISDINSATTLSHPVTFVASESAVDSGSLTLLLKSQTTADKILSRVVINYQLRDAAPYLYYSPAQVETGVTVDSESSETLYLENRGLIAMKNVNVQLLTGTNALAPSWISLAGASSLGEIAVGAKVGVGIYVSPQNRASTGVYQYKLRVTSSNAATTDIPVIVAVVEDGIGGVQFKLSDIYTATFDVNGELVKGLKGASISLQNIDVPNFQYSATTDELGEVYYPEIQAGTYRYRISASNHQELTGQITIVPGVVRNLDLFVNYNLISVEWVVNEITLEDRYEITLKATFETDVPAAVVVMEPASIRLPDMVKGDVFNGELTLTNYGLIRADNVKLTLPQSDEFYRYEFLTDVLPDTLAAKQSIVLPYRIISLQSLDPAANGNATGGGCYSYTQCAKEKHDFICPNGTVSNSSSRACWMRSLSSSCAGGESTSGGWIHGGGGGGVLDDGGFGSSDPQVGYPGCRDDDDDCDQENNNGGDGQ